MKVFYITNTRIPTEKAHGLQIVKTCEALSMAKNEVELIVPKRNNKTEQDAFGYYSIEKIFKIRYINSFDWFRFYKLIGASLSFKLQSLFFWISLIDKKLNKDSIIYTRNVGIAWLFKKKGFKTFYEAHVWPQSKVGLYKKILSNVDGIVANSKGTAEKFKENNFENILVAPNGVDLKKFEISKSKDELRRELDLSLEKKIVMYVGHLYKWKGAEVLIGAAKKLKEEKDILFVLIGGTKIDLEKYRKIILEEKIDNVLLLGHQVSDKIPKYLKTADILVLPNIANTKESKYYTSPIKMFEYMASGVPIIASALPSIKEVLNNDNSVLFKSGDIDDLVVKIGLVLQNNELQGKIATQALNDVQEFSWQKRADKIIKFTENEKDNQKKVR